MSVLPVNMCSKFWLLHGRLYWHRGVTVLLPGWVIWKYWNCSCECNNAGRRRQGGGTPTNNGAGDSSSIKLVFGKIPAPALRGEYRYVT